MKILYGFGKLKAMHCDRRAGILKDEKGTLAAVENLAQGVSKAKGHKNVASEAQCARRKHLSPLGNSYLVTWHNSTAASKNSASISHYSNKSILNNYIADAPDASIIHRKSFNIVN